MKTWLKERYEKLKPKAENQLQNFYDFMPAAVANMEKPPAKLARMITWTILIFCTIALLWLIFSKVDIVISAQGKLVPSGRTKVVQTPDEGVVLRIFVRDGQAVKAGDPIIELDSTSSEANQEQLNLKIAQATLAVQRLQAELGQNVEVGAGLNVPATLLETEKSLLASNKSAFEEKKEQLAQEFNQIVASLTASKAEITKLENSITHLTDKLAKAERQSKSGLIPKSQVSEARYELQSTRQDLNVAKQRTSEQEAKMSAAQDRFFAADTEHESELLQKLSEKKHELNSLQQDLIKAQEKIAYQTIRSPVNGIVQQLSVNTEGAVVTKAQELMIIVPEESMVELEAQILNKDIGFVESDQPVNVKVDAFEYTRYGMLSGHIEWVGGDAVLDEQKGQIYPARITLKEFVLPNKVGGRIAQVVPGMSATVDIVIGQRRLIEYFLAPMMRYKDESLRER